jgi:N6-adenosine-specific RNA methylase IME4
MSGEWPFGDLPMFGHRVIYADPPWPFENYSAKGESRNPNRHYSTLSLDQIKALPVGHLAGDTCALFMWVTDPLLDGGIDVMRAWGFRYVSVAFTWAKRTKLDTGWHMGTGYYTRANPEMCLLGMAGRSGIPASRGVRQLIVEPIREHSRKPDRVYSDIERMFAGPYVELFARSTRPGWSSWGNQVGKFDEVAA